MGWDACMTYWLTIAACSVTGYRKINNGTSQFTCSINPTEYFPNQHASGDCTMPEGALPFDILVA